MNAQATPSGNHSDSSWAKRNGASRGESRDWTSYKVPHSDGCRLQNTVVTLGDFYFVDVAPAGVNMTPPRPPPPSRTRRVVNGHQWSNNLRQGPNEHSTPSPPPPPPNAVSMANPVCLQNGKVACLGFFFLPSKYVFLVFRCRIGTPWAG